MKTRYFIETANKSTREGTRLPKVWKWENEMPIIYSETGKWLDFIVKNLPKIRLWKYMSKDETYYETTFTEIPEEEAISTIFLEEI